MLDIISVVCVLKPVVDFLKDKDLILSRKQQVIVGFLLFSASVAFLILALQRAEEKKALSNIKVVKTRIKQREKITPTSSVKEKPRKPKFPININKAKKDELILLPGIGPVLAEKIIEYRENIGTFTSKEDIMNVKGIGAKKYEKCKDLITVD